MTIVFLDRVDSAEKHATLRDDITAGLGLKKNISASGGLPFCKELIEFGLKGLNVEFRLITKLMVRGTETAAEIQELQFIKILRIVQEVVASLKEGLIVHKERTDMLIKSNNMQVILLGDFMDLRDVLGSDTELGLLTCRNDLIVMTGTYARVDTYRELTAAV